MQTCDPRQPQETLPEYANRVLRYALTYGIAPLTLEQLEQADTAAQQATCRLPAKLDPDAARLDAQLHRIRTNVQIALSARRAALQAAQAQLDQLYAQPEPADAPGAPQAPTQTPEQRAVQLLKAALILVMDPRDDRNGPGSPAKLVPPTPRIPPGGVALQTPTRPTLNPRQAPSGPDIAF